MSVPLTVPLYHTPSWQDISAVNPEQEAKEEYIEKDPSAGVHPAIHIPVSVGLFFVEKKEGGLH